MMVWMTVKVIFSLCYEVQRCSTCLLSCQHTVQGRDHVSFAVVSIAVWRVIGTW